MFIKTKMKNQLTSYLNLMKVFNYLGDKLVVLLNIAYKKNQQVYFSISNLMYLKESGLSSAIDQIKLLK